MPTEATPASGLSARKAIRSANLGLQAATGTGLGIGVASGLLLSTGNYQNQAREFDHLEAWMPLNLAKDQGNAQLKMADILEDALKKTFQGSYNTKMVEYQNQAVFGAVDTQRYLRIEGPGCENWSCMVSGPFPEAADSNLNGRMMTFNEKIEKNTISCPCYAYDGNGGIVFLKIDSESDEKGSINGHWHHFKTSPASFANEAFFQKLSSNLPNWVFFYVANQPAGTTMKVPAMFNQGERLY